MNEKILKLSSNRGRIWQEILAIDVGDSKRFLFVFTSGMSFIIVKLFC